MGDIDYSSEIENGITPSSFSPENKLSGIELLVPLYQRLFVWEEEQINQLLSDLYQACQKKDARYYIGALTVFKSSRDGCPIWELVDGQQRITVIALLGACLDKQAKDCQWKPFITKENDHETRLRYFARPDDQKDLKAIVENGPNAATVKNINMNNFIKLYKSFVERLDLDGIKEFSSYVYEKATALVSILPESYKVSDLNLYFEKMNAAGKQLEAHEILKVRDFGKYSARWNAVEDGSQAYKKPDSSENNSGTTNGITLKILLESDGNLLGKDKEEKEKAQATADSSRLVMDFPVFLLHVLRITVNDDLKEWNTKKLLSIFESVYKKWINDGGGPEKFITNMEKYRAWMDKWIIHIEDDNPVCPYNAQGNGNAKGNDKPESVDACAENIWQFQSMLYVSSDNLQRWILDAYLESMKPQLDDTPSDNNKEKFLNLLKSQDKGRRELPPENSPSWAYGKIDRYWFWKLDYILWELHRDRKLFTEKENRQVAAVDKPVDKYVFRRNRSIEHLHPQKSEIKWEGEGLHHFGNLAMISASFNSQQSNDTINTKFGRVVDQLKGNKLESIKLLCMFVAAQGKDSDWTPDVSEKHCTKMLDILRNWYNSVEQTNPVCGETSGHGEGGPGGSAL